MDSDLCSANALSLYWTSLQVYKITTLQLLKIILDNRETVLGIGHTVDCDAEYRVFLKYARRFGYVCCGPKQRIIFTHTFSIIHVSCSK